jgi:polyisoprenoid-binding protein YceI
MKKVSLIVALAVLGTGMLSEIRGEGINTTKSQIKWTGKKIGGSHYGFIQLKKGELEMDGDEIAKGTFVIDMTTISNTDMKSEESGQKLVGHLNSKDFFNVEEYPESTLLIKQSTPFENNQAKASADLTIKGITEEISFDVVQAGAVYTAFIEVDRSKFDVRYGSKSFFKDIGDKAIDDIFTMEVTMFVD